MVQAILHITILFMVRPHLLRPPPDTIRNRIPSLKITRVLAFLHRSDKVVYIPINVLVKLKYDQSRLPFPEVSVRR